MSKELSEIVGKLKIEQLKNLLTELDVTFDENLKKGELAELLIENFPEGKTIDEEGKIVEASPKSGQGNKKEDGEENVSRSESRRRQAREMLPEGKVRFTDNVKLRGTFFKKGDITEVTKEEEDMLVASNLVEFE